jgi:uncharacterized delta-60 repeat protein
MLGAAAAMVVILLVLSPALAAAGRGDRDRSFGGDGVAQLPGSDNVLRAAAVQRNGKLVAVGDQGAKAGNVRLLVARFNRNGSLDHNFNPGLAGLPLPGAASGVFVGAAGTVANAVAIQRNGRIVVAGKRSDGSGAGDRGMLLIRLNSNGTPDRSFSGDGVATAFTGRNGVANAVVLHGKRIVVAGAAAPSTVDAYPRTAVARFRLNGARDRRFGSKGATVLDFGRFSVANAISVLRRGKIVIAGSVRGDLQTTSLLAARLTARGSRDRGFSHDGLFTRQLARGAAYSAAFDLTRAWGGRIVLGGVATDGSVGSTALAVSLTPRGRLDRRFSGDGVAYLRATSDNDTFNQTQEPYPGAQGVASSGRDVVLGGYFDELTLKRLAVWALKRNGKLDRRFGRRGRTITSLGGRSAQLSDLAARGAKLYGVGDVSNLVDPPSGLAARYQAR